MAKKKYIVSEKFRGFYKLTHQNGKFEYINDKRLNSLKKDKDVSVVEFKEPKELEVKGDSNDDENLNTMNKTQLSEIAVRCGFKGDIEDVTKAVLIKFIEDKV